VISTSFYENPTIRVADNFRPINSKEKEFIEKVKKSEHELLKSLHLYEFKLEFFEICNILHYRFHFKNREY
jgi:hypothetical protein